MFSRVLSLLLLSFIVYGTTVEAAHTHGSLVAATTTVGTATFSDPGTEIQANRNLTGCDDCLICQLQQQFSATLIFIPPSIGPSVDKSGVFNLTAASVASQTNAPRRGRAPPFSL